MTRGLISKKAAVYYTDRGAPGDISVAYGEFIIKTERDWFEVETENTISQHQKDLICRNTSVGASRIRFYVPARDI
jgi:hypothetical protein